jgi:hypothetical protein
MTKWRKQSMDWVLSNLLHVCRVFLLGGLYVRRCSFRRWRSISTHGGGGFSGGVKDFGLMKILGLILMSQSGHVVYHVEWYSTNNTSILHWMEMFTK